MRPQELTIKKAKHFLHDLGVLSDKRLDLTMLDSQIDWIASEITFDKFIAEVTAITSSRSAAIG